ncbi:hypothetical protein [Streptomyces sp. NPDC054804]
MQDLAHLYAAVTRDKTTEPAGRHVLCGAMTKVDEGGHEPVHEDQLVFRPGAHGPATGARGEIGLVSLVPQRLQAHGHQVKASTARFRTPADIAAFLAPDHTCSKNA